MNRLDFRLSCRPSKTEEKPKISTLQINEYSVSKETVRFVRDGRRINEFLSCGGNKFGRKPYYIIHHKHQLHL